MAHGCVLCPSRGTSGLSGEKARLKKLQSYIFLILFRRLGEHKRSSKSLLLNWQIFFSLISRTVCPKAQDSGVVPWATQGNNKNRYIISRAQFIIGQPPATVFQYPSGRHHQLLGHHGVPGKGGKSQLAVEESTFVHVVQLCVPVYLQN